MLAIYLVKEFRNFVLLQIKLKGKKNATYAILEKLHLSSIKEADIKVKGLYFDSMTFFHFGMFRNYSNSYIKKG